MNIKRNKMLVCWLLSVLRQVPVTGEMQASCVRAIFLRHDVTAGAKTHISETVPQLDW